MDAVHPFARWWQRHDGGLLVFAGGALGSLARWLVGVVLPTPPGGLPWATLLVNLAGALILAFVVATVLRLITDDVRAMRYRLALGTGFCGGFTTYSTFMLESVQLAEAGRLVTLALYLALSLVGGLAAAASGDWLGQRLPVKARG